MARSLLALALLSLTATTASAQTPDFPDPPSRTEMLMRARATGATLAKWVNFTGFDDPNITLEDALDYLERRFNVRFSINDRAFKDENVKDIRSAPIGFVIPKMQNVPLGVVVRCVLARMPSRSGVTFFARRDEIEISTLRYYRYEMKLNGGIVTYFPPEMPKR
jgi:hypothetical protein